MERKTARFKLRLKESHKDRAVEILSILSAFYNHFLDERVRTYQESKKTLSAYDQSNTIKTIRTQLDPEKIVHTQLIQNVAHRLEDAFDHFFRRVKENKSGSRKKAPGFPRYKIDKRYRSMTFPQHKNGFKVIEQDGMVSKIKMTHIGSLPVHNRFRLPAGAVIHTGTLIREVDGFYFSLVYSCPPTPFVPSTKGQPLFPYSKLAHKPTKQQDVGIDVGVRDFLTTSDGDKINCSYLEKEFQKVRDLNGRLRRKRRELKRLGKQPESSRRYRDLRDRLARQYLKIFRIRQDFHRKVTAWFAQNFQNLYVEDLCIQNLLRKSFSRNHSRKIHQAGWSNFILTLERKAANAGGLVRKVDPSWTSQICADCLAHCPRDLSVKEHTCSACGYRVDRDHNAARNIKRLGKDPESLLVPRDHLRKLSQINILTDEAPYSLR